MGKRVTSASGRKWQRYNRWRAENRAPDRKRRLEKAAERCADLKSEISDFKGTEKKGRRPTPLFVVTIRCRDGERVKLAVHDGPWGLRPCATLVGRKVAAVVANYRPAELARRACVAG